MRPIYESKSDKNAEAEVIDELRRCAEGGQFIKLPDLAVIDYIALDSSKKPCALLEVKVRKNAAAKYPTYMISERKIKDALSVSKLTNIPFILVVSWLGDIRWVKVKALYPTAIGGRYDRGDSQDIERVCLIPISDFIKVPE